jgi:hypothetical protein
MIRSNVRKEENRATENIKKRRAEQYREST